MFRRGMFKTNISFYPLFILFCLHGNVVGLQDSVASQSDPKGLRSSKGSVWRHILIGAVSGAAAGFVTDVSCYPIESIKTRLQSGPSHKSPNTTPSLTQLVKSLFSGVEVILVLCWCIR